MRELGTQLIADIFKDVGNRKLFEELVYNKNKDKPKKYFDTIYQLSGLVLSHDIKTCYNIIEKDKLGWELDIFGEDRDNEELETNFIDCPFEAVDSIMECNCGSKRISSMAKQLRGLDEGTSVLCKCFDCGKKWIESG